MKAKILKSKTKSKKPATPKSVEPAIAGVEKALSVMNQDLLNLGGTEKKPAKKTTKRKPKETGILKDEYVCRKIVGIDGDTAKNTVTKKARSKTTEPDALPIENYTQKTWYEFKNTGLLLFVNTFLHIFGWAICVVTDAADQVIAVYPARTRYRGFSGESLSNAYVKLSEYIHKNHKALLDEARD
jgi:hypothetical protein